MVTLTIGADRRITADGRLFCNAAEAIRVSGLPEGADPSTLRIYIVAPQGVVVAYRNGFAAGSAQHTVEGTVAMDTTAMRSALGFVAEGRFVRLAVVAADNGDTTYGSGFVDVVKATPITAPIQLEAATIAEIKALLAAMADTEEPETIEGQWDALRGFAQDIADKL